MVSVSPQGRKHWRIKDMYLCVSCTLIKISTRSKEANIYLINVTVSRPCKRCVALGKTDTCQDIKHKKRGRPRLRDKQASGDGKGNDSGYEVMYGTIQTPSFTAHQQPSQPPLRQQSQPRPVAPHRTSPEVSQQQRQTTTISFIHEPIESFQEQQEQTQVPASQPQVQSNDHQHHFIQQQQQQLHQGNQNNSSVQSADSNGTFIHEPVQLIPHTPFDELLYDSNNMIQQYMIPPYMTMPMQQQAFSQPEQQQQAPETMSLQMKMGNAFAQRPTSLPLAPAASPPQQMNQHQQRQHQHQLVVKQKDTRNNSDNDFIESTNRQEQQHSPQQQMDENDVNKPKGPHSPINSRRFSMNYSNGNNGNSIGKERTDVNQTITFILSMEVCCARVSEEVTGMWGYYPQEFAHRSLYDFISPKDTDRLGRLHRLLLDNIVDVAKSKEPPTQTERTTSELFHKMEQEQLTVIAPGSSTFSDTLHVKKRSGEEELYEMLVCMGGGLGADLHQPASHSNLYIIAQFRKYRYEVSAQNTLEDTIIARATTSPGRLMSSSFTQTSSSSMLTSNNGKHSSKNDEKISLGNNNKPSSNFNSGLKRNSSFLKPNPPFRHTMARTITDLGRGGPSMDMRSRSSLPSHYATSSHLNTISKIEPAKVNVAPITQRSSPSFASSSLKSSWQNRIGKSSFSSSSSTSSSSNLYDQYHHHNDNNNINSISSHGNNNNHNQRHLNNSSPDNSDSTSSSSSSSASTTTFTAPSSANAAAAAAAAATTVTKPTFVSAPLSSARESGSRYSTLATYRFAPVPPTKMTTGSPHGGPNVTHPTTQYFLQTSSSTLNAAASAAQYSSRNTYHSASSMADNDKASGKTDSNRKVEMSIRSLLC
ncbi:hypothetical protein BDC45DRAFT_197980 [Circinella umbellata]|nr:hypothetical protein BDC45DRAFT_197980 [Circinella umbellata]